MKSMFAYLEGNFMNVFFIMSWFQVFKDLTYYITIISNSAKCSSDDSVTFSHHMGQSHHHQISIKWLSNNSWLLRKLVFNIIIVITRDRKVGWKKLPSESFELFTCLLGCLSMFQLVSLSLLSWYTFFWCWNSLWQWCLNHFQHHYLHCHWNHLDNIFF